MPAPVPKKIFARRHEIFADYLKELDKHLDDVLNERTNEMLEIRDIAGILNIHPKHLTNTIKELTGKSPCWFFEDKIMAIAKDMLQKNSPVKEIAFRLTFDASNFTKFFKRFEGITPKEYRDRVLGAVTQPV
ncbi:MULTISPECIES: helix-turn-helix domain-containing protein [unclassified Mucilaginibacter]|uniref:helix-turn-helix domain-containing protein n=1 Tax=unclassified Mucilaginibacter TaxID=2617802 RepID=UPI0009617AAD|nr:MULTISPECIES: helix-turn-helix domain-containing protein [unclassified Mucilaginibacter]OJW13409.1 MAG: AraC family transcriptional regulator [Mucilaginibacter sp. 44-25]PLW89113.1 MAG: AraC family transcriptional regulator [Mucilaginibacter sp.]HEK19814.1 AraC family transcriptional regulator [Bacteroidota bacterium]